MPLTPHTYEEIWAILAENRKQIAEVGEFIKATELQIQENDEQLNALGIIEDASDKFSKRKVRLAMFDTFAKRGIKLTESVQNFVIEKDGVYLLEIDLLLINTIYSVIVEVKNALRQRDIDEHIERLRKLQEYPHKFLKGTTMFGAVAAMIVSQEVEHYAIQNGLFVIKPNGDSVEISNKPDFQPAEWYAKA